MTGPHARPTDTLKCRLEYTSPVMQVPNYRRPDATWSRFVCGKVLAGLIVLGVLIHGVGTVADAGPIADPGVGTQAPVQPLLDPIWTFDTGG